MPQATQKDNQVTTGEVRLSYANLFTPRAQDENDTPKYSCVIIIPKTDKSTLRAIKAAQAAAVENGKSKHFGGKVPANLATTMHDGDEEGDLERNPEYEGCYYMNVSAKKQPGLIDRNRQAILSEEDLYSGCYVRVQLGGFAYNYKGKKGVSFGLNHVQKLRDGENLSGVTSVDAAFDDDLEDLDDEDGEDLI